jgi:hypothetical protein
MLDYRSGRQIYCVVTDKYGNTVKSKTVTLTIAPAVLTITAQPKDTVVPKAGDTATVPLKATGDGLTYQWYYKNPNMSKFSKSSITKDTYVAEMLDYRSGRQIYCVITDKYGNTVKSETVTLTIAPVKITA